MFYRLEYLSVFHPRPLQAGGFLGQRQEIQCAKKFKAEKDSYAICMVPSIINSHSKLPQTPYHSKEPKRLLEVNRQNEELRVVKSF